MYSPCSWTGNITLTQVQTGRGQRGTLPPLHEVGEQNPCIPKLLHVLSSMPRPPSLQPFQWAWCICSNWPFGQEWHDFSLFCWYCGVFTQTESLRIKVSLLSLMGGKLERFRVQWRLWKSWAIYSIQQTSAVEPIFLLGWVQLLVNELYWPTTVYPIAVNCLWH